MKKAFTFNRGESEGELLKMQNPVYHKKAKELQGSVEKARGK